MICSRDGTLLCYGKKNSFSLAVTQMRVEDILLSKVKRHRNTNTMQFYHMGIARTSSVEQQCTCSSSSASILANVCYFSAVVTGHHSQPKEGRVCADYGSGRVSLW